MRRLVMAGLLALVTGQAVTAPSPQRQAELRDLLRQDCGSCHGMTLKGGLGPALTAQALQGKSRRLLTVTIREGRPGTPMPPWKNLLQADEIDWLVDHLLAGATP